MIIKYVVYLFSNQKIQNFLVVMMYLIIKNVMNVIEIDVHFIYIMQKDHH